MRHEEFHVTVTGDPLQWRGFCAKQGIKPLWIELNNFNTQLMCAAAEDPSAAIAAAGWNIVRVKHEVQAPPSVDISTHSEPVLYYECHVKFDGRFQPQFKMTSRDLFRMWPGDTCRWYATRRQESPFDPEGFAKFIGGMVAANLVEYEYEACLRDTNPGLDARWAA